MAESLTSRKRGGLTPAEKVERNSLIEQYMKLKNVLTGRGINAPSYGRSEMIDWHPDEIRAKIEAIKKVALQKGSM